MRKITLMAAATLAMLLSSRPESWADVYVTKTGQVIEGKTVKIFQKKIPGQGGPKNYYTIQKEDGKTEDLCEKDIAYVVKARLSWEVRAENQAWYKKDEATVKPDWQSRESFAKKVRAKKYLEAEAEVEFKKAYKLRKPEIKDEISAHESFARQLESDWEIYEEAKDEWRWVCAKRAETCDTPGKLVTLAKWCIDEGLYDEADDMYDSALKINPAYKDAVRGKRRLANAPKVNGQFFRALTGKLNAMCGLLDSKRKGDGSFGSDINEAAVHGYAAMSALCGMAMLARWDFAVMKDYAAMDNCPAYVKNVIPWICLANPKSSIPEDQSKDVWGPIWRLEFLAQAYKHESIGETLRKGIAKKVADLFIELKNLARPDGGWAYYEFVPDGITFVTACAIVAILDVKEAGLPIDEAMLARACDSVGNAQQAKKGLFGYHNKGHEDEVGCAGRSALCSYALIRAGKGDMEMLTNAVENFFKHRHLLEAIKDKEGTHIGKGMTAPYYYMFGHYWTTRAIHLLPKEKQTEYYKKMRDILARNMKANGEFTDTPLTKDNEVYGTALGALWAYQIAIDEWRMKKDADDDDGKPEEGKPAEKSPGTPTQK